MIVQDDNVLVYRGYRWTTERLLDNVRISAYALWHYEVVVIVVAVAPFYGELKDRLQQTLSGISVFYPIWQRAHERRLEERQDNVVMVAVDGVPWEIHEIEDETAYEHALAEYQLEHARLIE